MAWNLISDRISNSQEYRVFLDNFQVQTLYYYYPNGSIASVKLAKKRSSKDNDKDKDNDNNNNNGILLQEVPAPFGKNYYIRLRLVPMRNGMYASDKMYLSAVIYSIEAVINCCYYGCCIVDSYEMIHHVWLRSDSDGYLSLFRHSYYSVNLLTGQAFQPTR